MSVLLIVAVVALVAGITGAYFADQQTSDNNAITAGTLSPTLNTTQPFDLTNAAPGDSGDALVEYYNDPFISTLPTKVRITATEAADGDPEMFAALTVQAYVNDGTGEVAVGDAQPLSSFSIVPADLVAAGRAGVVNPGDTMSWRFHVVFPVTADNTTQGLTSGFSFVFDSTQESNPGWVQ